jgi:hypothetical protein
MADDTTFVIPEDPAPTPATDLRRLNANDIAEPEAGLAPALAPSRPPTAPGRRPLFRN